MSPSLLSLRGLEFAGACSGASPMSPSLLSLRGLEFAAADGLSGIWNCLAGKSCLNAFVKALILGSGGREHALTLACVQSGLFERVWAAPGNAGMAEWVACEALDIEDKAAVGAFVKARGIGFVVVGPELPLTLGLADSLRADGVLVYGTGARGAQLEASKVFSKKLMGRHGIPTAAAMVFEDFESLRAELERPKRPYPLVLKADGLAAGKGAFVCANQSEALEAAALLLLKKSLGAAGEQVLLEEFLEGEEASLMLMVSADGSWACLPASQDHKRAFDGDKGPNTGGMGAYAPASIASAAVLQKAKERIVIPLLEALKAERIDYSGTLYIGLMVDASENPSVVEFNVRFGDPECQVLMALVKNAAALMLACARGEALMEPELKQGYAALVVLAAEGYPQAYTKGGPIELPENYPKNCQILHAGTMRDAEGTLRVAGGRVLGICAQAPSLQACVAAAYELTHRIGGGPLRHRSDIAQRQLQRDAEA